MPIPLHISPRIMSSIASLYNDSNRVMMEFIDNSLDSAEQYFDSQINGYKKNIKIVLEINGKKYTDGSVVITDNCTGISNLPKVVQSIGDSDKKAQEWTNGQFGYGIYSFMAVCGKLEIISKIKNEYSFYIPIMKQQFQAKKIDEVFFPDPEKTSRFIKNGQESGTVIILSNFDRNNWKDLDFDELKNEIEKHFELLLKRKNLLIQLINHDGKKHNCHSFNYNQYEGEEYEDSIEELSYTTGRINKMLTKLSLKNPIHIYLKVLKGKSLNRNPVFVAKGRRIGEIKDIRAFKSSHKSDIWAHPNITGFVDVKGFLEPTIARTDFKNTSKTKALFAALIELEPLILDVINEVNKEATERHYQKLEDKLNQALSKLAKLDLMNYRTAVLSGSDINLSPNGAGQTFGEGQGQKDRGQNGKGGDGPGGENEGEGLGPGGDRGNIPGGDKGEGPKDKEADNPFEDTGFKGTERKKSGFDVKIVDTDLQIAEATNKPYRSLLVGGQIRIYRKHPDFQSRVDTNRRKEKRITQRLVTYLAGEITVHYKDKLHNKTGQPQYDKSMFIDLVEFIYLFEDMLKELVGKNLADVLS